MELTKTERIALLMELADKRALPESATDDLADMLGVHRSTLHRDMQEARGMADTIRVALVTMAEKATRNVYEQSAGVAKGYFCVEQGTLFVVEIARVSGMAKWRYSGECHLDHAGEPCPIKDTILEITAIDEGVTLARDEFYCKTEEEKEIPY